MSEQNNDQSQNDNRYVTFWLLFLLAAIIVVGGWFFMVRFNFQNINKSMNNNGLTTEQAFEQMKNIMTEAKDVINQAGDDVKEAITEEEANKIQKTTEQNDLPSQVEPENSEKQILGEAEKIN